MPEAAKTTKKRTKPNREGPPSQILLVQAMSRELIRQGYREGESRHFNAMIKAANLIVDKFARQRKPAYPDMNLELWLESDDTGQSSLAIAYHLDPRSTPLPRTGNDQATDATPLDPEDFGRCVGLLDAVPEFRSRLGEMTSLSPTWARLVAAWDELEALYREELPSGTAPKTYARLREILEASS